MKLHVAEVQSGSQRGELPIQRVASRIRKNEAEKDESEIAVHRRGARTVLERRCADRFHELLAALVFPEQRQPGGQPGGMRKKLFHGDIGAVGADMEPAKLFPPCGSLRYRGGFLDFDELMAGNSFGRTVVAFFDDDCQKWHRRIHDVPVVGMPECLLVGWAGKLDEVILAIPEARPSRAREIRRVIDQAGLRVYTPPASHNLSRRNGTDLLEDSEL